jgi:prepilin-type N-terminal cleavage/methylation domain-containing protein
MKDFFNKNKIKTAGMTLIELLVVITIFTIVSAITIFNYGTFRSSASMQNLADDVALSVRKAQSYAIGAYGSSANFSYGYGIHFSTTQVPVANYQSGSNKSFVGFTDVDPTANKRYDYDNTNTCGTPSATNECNELLKIITADQISNIYLNESAMPVATGGAVDIVFIRPDPTAYLCYRPAPGTGSCDVSTPLSHVKIEVDNGQTGNLRRSRNITVWTTGQISSL